MRGAFMKSVLVIGMGKFGRHFAKKMMDLGNDVMIVDKDEAIVERYAATFSDAQIADCTNKDVLLTLAVHHFDICILLYHSHPKKQPVIRLTRNDSALAKPGKMWYSRPR